MLLSVFPGFLFRGSRLNGPWCNRQAQKIEDLLVPVRIGAGPRNRKMKELKEYQQTLRYIVSLNVENFDRLSRKELEYKLKDAINMARKVLNLKETDVIL